MYNDFRPYEMYHFATHFVKMGPTAPPPPSIYASTAMIIDGTISKFPSFPKIALSLDEELFYVVLAFKFNYIIRQPHCTF